MPPKKKALRLADQLLQLTSGPAPDDMSGGSEDDFDAQVEDFDEDELATEQPRGLLHSRNLPTRLNQSSCLLNTEPQSRMRLGQELEELVCRASCCYFLVDLLFP